MRSAALEIRACGIDASEGHFETELLRVLLAEGLAARGLGTSGPIGVEDLEPKTVLSTAGLRRDLRAFDPGVDDPVRKASESAAGLTTEDLSGRADVTEAFAAGSGTGSISSATCASETTPEEPSATGLSAAGEGFEVTVDFPSSFFFDRLQWMQHAITKHATTTNTPTTTPMIMNWLPLEDEEGSVDAPATAATDENVGDALVGDVVLLSRPDGETLLYGVLR